MSEKEDILRTYYDGITQRFVSKLIFSTNLLDIEVRSEVQMKIHLSLSL